MVDTPFGKVGGLNCWEHSQTLLRYYEYAQDVDIHVASWPLIWDEPDPKDLPDWQYHITGEMNARISQVMAMEGATFVIVSTQILTDESREKCQLKDFKYARQGPGGGFSRLYGPDAAELVKPLDPGDEHSDVSWSSSEPGQESTSSTESFSVNAEPPAACSMKHSMDEVVFAASVS